EHKTPSSEPVEIKCSNYVFDPGKKEGDGACHIRIELIDPDGEKFDRAFQSIPTNRRLSLKENLSEILNLDHFHDS
ncbi:hypothetical protein Tco_0192902, partial [Tanacetum coccineum]